VLIRRAVFALAELVLLGVPVNHDTHNFGHVFVLENYHG
jgi:hypothetical protein